MYMELTKFEEKYSESQIQKEIDRIAYEIEKDLQNDHLVVICILKGAVPFCTDLMKRLSDIPIVIDYIELSSYNGKTSSSGTIQLKKDITLPDILINGRNVLIVEDIVDSGLTIKWLIDHLNNKYKMKSLKVAALVNKTYRREHNVKINYVGFNDTSTDFLAGYGLDDNEFMRNMNNIVKIIN